jgi:hypothetical protein
VLRPESLEIAGGGDSQGNAWRVKEVERLDHLDKPSQAVFEMIRGPIEQMASEQVDAALSRVVVE